ncbi:hypothetical protein ACP70R_035566 [Stipagrostis hirtigluma subsp. patula]
MAGVAALRVAVCVFLLASAAMATPGRNHTGLNSSTTAGRDSTAYNSSLDARFVGLGLHLPVGDFTARGGVEGLGP